MTPHACCGAIGPGVASDARGFPRTRALYDSL